MGQRAEVGARGFTLLELLVTLLVLSVMVALGLPAIGRSTETIRARAEVAHFAAILRRAREDAIASREPRTVVVDPEARQVRVVSGQDQGRTAWAWPPSLAVRAALPGGLAVRFEPHGVSSGADFLLSDGPWTWRVLVDPLTGRIRTTRG